MKYAKTYIVLALIVLVAFFIKINTWDSNYGQVEEFRGASLKQEIFYPMMARSVNDSKDMTIILDGQEYSGKLQDVILGNDLKPYVDVNFLREQFNLSARAYDSSKMVVTCNGHNFNYDTDDGCFLSNQRLYVPLELVCGDLSIGYKWDRDDYKLTINSKNLTSSLPSQFDLRDINCAADIKDQGSSASCWANASVAVLESSLLPEKISFDVDDMVNNKAFSLTEKDAGDYAEALAYLVSWEGPKISNLSSKDTSNAKTVKHLQDALFFDHSDREDIKWAVYKYGGVSTSAYIKTTGQQGASYYNKETYSYCYNGDNEPNHELVIIGWDDNYSASNFASMPQGDGAFICQNSWGTDFGDSGVFYVSYYDSNIGAQAVSYSLIDNGLYNSIHQTDLCGYTGRVGYSQDYVFGANVYRVDKDEDIKAAGFYTLEDDVDYNIYIVKDYNGKSDLNHRELVASGTCNNAGYHTVEFAQSYRVKAKDKFAIIIELKSDQALNTNMLAIEYKRSGDRYANITLADGEGYLSEDGKVWADSEEQVKGNVCLKAYGSSID